MPNPRLKETCGIAESAEHLCLEISDLKGATSLLKADLISTEHSEKNLNQSKGDSRTSEALERFISWQSSEHHLLPSHLPENKSFLIKMQQHLGPQLV